MRESLRQASVLGLRRSPTLYVIGTLSGRTAHSETRVSDIRRLPALYLRCLACPDELPQQQLLNLISEALKLWRVLRLRIRTRTQSFNSALAANQADFNLRCAICVEPELAQSEMHRCFTMAPSPTTCRLTNLLSGTRQKSLSLGRCG